MLRRAMLAAALVAALACSKAPGKKGPVVAQGGGVTVTANEFKARLDEQSPMIRASFQNLDRKKQFLDNMLRFELLAKAAEKEGLANDPDVLFTMKKVMVSKYYQRFFQDQSAAAGVPESDVKKYYDEHADEFHRPARVHAAHVFVKAEAGTPERAKKAVEAKKLLAKLLVEEKKNPNAFATLARASSDDAATKNQGGDLAMKAQPELEKDHGKEVAEVVFKLGDNQTAPTVVEEPHGFHLVRVLGRQVEVSRGFDEVKAQVTARLNSQKKSKDFDEFVKKLRADANIQVNDAELEKVAVAAPSMPPGAGAMPRPLATPLPAAPPAHP